MKHIQQTIALFIFMTLLSGCGGASNSESAEVDDDNVEIKDNEITSADGSTGFKGDIDNTNLQTIYEGLTFERAFLVDGSDNAINGEQVSFNSQFSIVFDGIKNFTLVNGKAFPKLSMIVTGDKGPVVNEENLLASYTEGLSPEDAAVLRGTVTVGEPMEVGKQYVLSITITDANNKDVSIASSWLFTIK